jgi:hypothetical protein
LLGFFYPLHLIPVVIQDIHGIKFVKYFDDSIVLQPKIGSQLHAWPHEQKTDSVQGFAKVADLLVHYSFIDGSYKLQTTEQPEIKGWLNAKERTWQAGLPQCQ